jgi:hypothetical protein
MKGRVNWWCTLRLGFEAWVGRNGTGRTLRDSEEMDAEQRPAHSLHMVDRGGDEDGGKLGKA